MIVFFMPCSLQSDGAKKPYRHRTVYYRTIHHSTTHDRTTHDRTYHRRTFHDRTLGYLPQQILASFN